MLKYIHPEEIEGHTIVAVTSDRTTGLYREGGDYFLVDAQEGGEFSESRREELGQLGYPPCPRGKWRWIPGRQPWVDGVGTTQIKEKSIGAPPSGVGRTFSSSPVKSDTCSECGRENIIRSDGHYHTTTDAGGFCKSVCCPCTKKRGFTCRVS